MKNRKKIERRVTDYFSALVKNQGLLLYKSNFEGDNHSAKYICKAQGKSYYFFLRFIYRPIDKTLHIEPTVFVSYPEVTEIVKSVGGSIPFEETGKPVAAAYTESYLHPENQDGFLRNRNRKHITIDPTNDTIQQAAEILYVEHFKKGVLQFIEETDSLKKLDRLCNEFARPFDEGKIKITRHFPFRPDQVLTGIIAAKLVNNPNYEQLKKRYLEYAKELAPETNNSTVEDILKVIECFDKQEMSS